MELIRTVCKYSPELMEKYDSLHGNAKMTSPEIQNELLAAASSILLQHIRKEVVYASYYALIADECKDESKREIIGVSLRYYCEGKIRERAVGFIETCHLTAMAISDKLLEVLSFFSARHRKMCGFFL